MEEIRDVVENIVVAAKAGGMEVSETLAAFMARTVIEELVQTTGLDRRIPDQRVRRDIAERSLERLLTQDSPSVDTMRMQVDFDSSYLSEEAQLERRVRQRARIQQEHRNQITDIIPRDSNDYESLTTMYRRIFQYLLEFYPREETIPPSSPAEARIAEREIAAALESVFPRIGLRTFAQLSTRDKQAQLIELCTIVLGIRLFNREQQRGGSGIDASDEKAEVGARSLIEDSTNEIVEAQQVCNAYQNALVVAHRKRRTMMSVGRNPDDEREWMVDPSISPVLLERWASEQANRRQFLSFLSSLKEDSEALAASIIQLRERYKNEISTLHSLVGAKSSVPKDQVYPRFDAAARAWLQLLDEKQRLEARQRTLEVLAGGYKHTYTPMRNDLLVMMQGISDAPESVVLGDGEGDESDVGAQQPPQSQPQEDKGGLYSMDALALTGGVGGDGSAVDNLDGPSDAKDDGYNRGRGGSESKSSTSNIAGGVGASATGAVLLSVQATPEFMQLPLAFQGYCPWTLVRARGLLVPGIPSLGVVQYLNHYYVFANKKALLEFMDQPQRYIKGVKDIAALHPEYIHLLRLQQQFPDASIARLLQRPQFDGLVDVAPEKRDASTETPVHFVKRHIDNNYHWNEWELRRRALKVANLQKCATSETQTDQSHFRRDNDSQVYLPKNNETQTMREKGTNPPQTVTFVAGLRGAVDPTQPSVSRFIDRDINDAAGTVIRMERENSRRGGEEAKRDDAGTLASSTVQASIAAAEMRRRAQQDMAPVEHKYSGMVRREASRNATVVQLTLDL